MQFTYDVNSEEVEMSLEAFESSLRGNSPTLRVVADDFREMIAAPQAGREAARKTRVLGARELGGTAKG